jgi:hypothetical protein
VTSRDGGGKSSKMCRTCGVEVMALQFQSVRQSSRGFFMRVPGAFVYPFRGFGVAVLLIAVAVFGGMDYLLNMGILGGPFGWVIRASVYGLLFLFMQNIIYTTTSDETEALGFPDASGLFGAAFTLGATVLVSFGLAIGLFVATVFFDVAIPPVAIGGAVILGCLYFPMAFLVVAMKDTVVAANPLIVIPSIMKIPFQYLIASILLMSVFGVRKLGDILSSAASHVTLSTRARTEFLMSVGMQAIMSFVGIYLLTVSIRILGLLYNANKEKLGWFTR